MAYFAQISDGVVTNVVSVNNNELLLNGVENEQKGKEFCQNLLGGEWIQTSYNNRIRKQYASVGFTYDADADEFVAPQPYSSWTLDSNNDWQAPTAKPNDGKMYTWNEASLAWVEVAG
jgi:hypothetical protein